VRRRLLAAFVGMTILTILLFGVPRVFITAELARDAEAQDLDRVAAAIAGLVSEELLQGVQPSVQAIAAVLGSGEVARLTGGGIDTPLVVGAATLKVHEGCTGWSSRLRAPMTPSTHGSGGPSSASP
jgi:hypothetical protein